MQAYQLPLCLKLHDTAIFDNFFVGENTQLINTLKLFLSKQTEQFIYCYGESGSGRTHLLQACCHEMDKDIFYLPLENYTELSPEIFEALEDQRTVCIDNIDCIMGNAAWEEALFHFYNRARDNKVALLVSATCAPQQLNCALSDLKSRLSWGLALEIKSLKDEEKIQALQMRAAARGFHLSDEVGHYLIHHYSRNMRDLFFVLEKLDGASLVAKRRLTIPFVKATLEK